MIEFIVTTDQYGDRTLRLPGESGPFGWIERGRSFIDQYGHPYAEWRFTPFQGAGVNGDGTYPVHTDIGSAYTDARSHAALRTTDPAATH